jgi:hypothetical protein
MIFFVICVFGSRTRSIHRYCGPNVARENACLILSLLRMSSVAVDVDDEKMELVDSMMDVASTIIDRDDEGDDDDDELILFMISYLSFDVNGDLGSAMLQLLL